MEQDSKQEDSLKKTIGILAEITRKDIRKSSNLKNFSNTKVSLPMMALSPCQLSKELSTLQCSP